MRKRATVFYSGRVQGVGFRYTAREIACGYELTEYVRNLNERRVDVPCDKVVSRLHVGFLPENPYFYRYLTGAETLVFYGKLCGMNGSSLKNRIEELLELVGLTRARDRQLSGYSKGMLQRIGLAQALIHDPKLLLLDEPTAGVDPIGSREIRDLILQLKSMGKTVMFCSHLLEQVQEVCDRIGVLKLGKMSLES